MLCIKTHTLSLFLSLSIFSPLSMSLFLPLSLAYHSSIDFHYKWQKTEVPSSFEICISFPRTHRNGLHAHVAQNCKTNYWDPAHAVCVLFASFDLSIFRNSSEVALVCRHIRSTTVDRVLWHSVAFARLVQMASRLIPSISVYSILLVRNWNSRPQGRKWNFRPQVERILIA